MLPLVALALSAALQLPPSAPPVTRFSGHLTHAPAGDAVQLTVGRQHVQLPLSASGDFQFEFRDLAVPAAVEFDYAGQHTSLYLSPGDQVRMTLDFQDFDKTVVYSGRGANASNYLAQALYKFEYGPAGDVVRPFDVLKSTTPPAEMHRVIDAFRQSRLAFLAAYGQAHPLPAAFRHDTEFLINLTWATQRLAYLAYQRSSPPAGGSPPVATAADFDFLQQAPLRELGQHFGRGVTENTAVALFLREYSARLVAVGQLGRDPAAGERIYQLATTELGDNRLRDMALEMLLSNKMRTDLPGALAFYPTFRQHTRDSATARSVRQALAARQQVGSGRPAPSFTLLDNTGKSVSLSDFKGKVVYLDFWGTWCHPCLNEMTNFAPALKKQFEGRDVVFLYIAVGDAEARWQQVLTEQHFTSANSVHLRSPTNDEATAYQVDGYPSYYLIGRDGRFIKMYASRPSQGAETVAAIEAALSR